jgi:hypothetical protein
MERNDLPEQPRSRRQSDPQAMDPELWAVLHGEEILDEARAIGRRINTRVSDLVRQPQGEPRGGEPGKSLACMRLLVHRLVSGGVRRDRFV